MKFFIFWLFLSISTQARAQWRFLASYESLDSKNYTGSMLGGQVHYKIPEGSVFGGVRSLSRQYPGAQLQETAYDLGGAHTWFPGTYLEGSTSQSPESDILPQQTYSLAVHFLSEKADYGVGLSRSQYRLTEATTVRPFYFSELIGDFRGGGEIFWVFSDRAVVAGHLFGVYDWSDRHTFRADFSGGETLEDAGLQARFSSISGEYGYRRSRWGVFFSVTSYRSDLRREASYGVRLQLQ